MLNSFIDLTEIYDLNSSFSIFNAIKKPEDRLKMLEIKLFNIFLRNLKNGACRIYFYCTNRIGTLQNHPRVDATQFPCGPATYFLSFI